MSFLSHLGDSYLCGLRSARSLRPRRTSYDHPGGLRSGIVRGDLIQLDAVGVLGRNRYGRTIRGEVYGHHHWDQHHVRIFGFLPPLLRVSPGLEDESDTS